MRLRWCLLAAVLAPVLAPLLAGCAASDKKVIDSATSSHQQLAPALMTDPMITRYFAALGQRIVTAAKADDRMGIGPESHHKGDNSWMFSGDVEFHLVNSKTLNAFTTGGHHVYVYNALLQLCSNETELAAVMSHEFAHIYCRHVQQGMGLQQREMGLAGAAAVGGYVYGGASDAQTAAGAAYKGAQFLGMGYTRHDEAQADEYGFGFFSLAGWDPNHFGDFFQAMIAAGYDKTPTYLSDHPMLKDRVVAAKQRAADWTSKHGEKLLQPPTDDDAAFAAMKARAAQIAAATPSDANLKQAQGLLASFSSCVSPAEQQPEQVSIRELLHDAVGTPTPPTSGGQ